MRLLRKLVLAIVALVAIAYAYAWRGSFAPIERTQTGTFQTAEIQRGATLAAIGNCMSCHTRDDGAGFAGGRPIDTPFGRIFSTNISPDPRTGIGMWSLPAFARAMRDGVSRDGRHLYPAFPYDHMSKTTDDDIKAVYAFMMTRTPVAATTQPNTLGFPYNQRWLIAGWKLLFHDRSAFRPDPAKSAEWNRGAYLVEGLAHCGSCHTPRNGWGAEDRSRAYMGADVDGWTAPALGPTSLAALPWTAERLADYLAKGRPPHHGSAAGPMAPVIRNLAEVPDADIKAMAVYVASLAGTPTAERLAAARRAISRAKGEGPTSRSANGPGAQIYAGACAGCHGDAGRAPSTPALNLALSTSVRNAVPDNLVRVVMSGLGTSDNQPGPRMPGFAHAMTDAQISDLVSFVRASFTDRPAFAGVDVAIKRAR